MIDFKRYLKLYKEEEDVIKKLEMASGMSVDIEPDNINLAAFILSDAIKLAKSNNHNFHLVQLLLDYAALCVKNGKSDIALNQIESNLYLFVKYPEYHLKVLNLLGVIYNKIGKHALSISYFVDACKVAIESGDDYKKLVLFKNLNVEFEKLGIFDLAEKFRQKTFLLLHKWKGVDKWKNIISPDIINSNSYRINVVNIHITICLDLLGFSAYNKEYLSFSKTVINKTTELLKSQNNLQTKIYLTVLEATFFYKTNNFKLGNEKLVEAKKLVNKSSLEYNSEYLKFRSIFCFQLEGKHKKAIKQLMKLIGIDKKANVSKKIRTVELLEFLVKAYERDNSRKKIEKLCKAILNEFEVNESNIHIVYWATQKLYNIDLIEEKQKLKITNCFFNTYDCYNKVKELFVTDELLPVRELNKG